MTDIAGLRKFLKDAIANLEDEAAAYRGFLALLEQADQLDPRTETMLLDLARKDNRLVGRR